MRRLALLLSCVVLTGCGSQSGTTAGSAEPDGAGGARGSITWGSGDYGVVLAHGAAFDAASWETQAKQMAAQGATVMAVEDTSTEGLAAAVKQLQDGGIEDVALVGGSAGADSILDLASHQPDLPDQLILLSPNSAVDGLGEEPKLFIASEDESVADVSTELADSSPGSENRAELLPGSAHAQNIFGSDQGQRALDLVLERLRRFS